MQRETKSWSDDKLIQEMIAIGDAIQAIRRKIENEPVEEKKQTEKKGKEQKKEFNLNDINQKKEIEAKIATMCEGIRQNIFSEQDSMADKIQKLQQVIQRIPDTQVEPYIKIFIAKQICTGRNASIPGQILDYSYVEPLPPLKKVFAEEHAKAGSEAAYQHAGDISAREYATALKAKKLDQSDFILLTIGFLQTISSKCDDVKSAQNEINKLRELYFDLNYQTAISVIKFLTKKYEKLINAEQKAETKLIPDKVKKETKDKEVSSPPSLSLEEVTIQAADVGKKSVTQNILKKMKELQSKEATKPLSETILATIPTLVVPDITKNHSRRHFENRVAQFYSGSVEEFKFSGIEKIAQAVLGKTTPIKSFEEAKMVVLAVPEKLTRPLAARSEQLKAASPLYKNKDRRQKAGILSKEEEKEGLVSSSERIFSQTQGIKKSTSPAYPDEQSKHKQINRMPDTTMTEGKASGYPHKRAGAAFVSSLSGHTYDLVAILEKYMTDHPKDPQQLTEDINQFIKLFIISYIDRGYHGITEITDVLNESRDIFNKMGVTLDLTFPQRILESASKETQDYAKTNCLRSAVGQELVSIDDRKEAELKVESVTMPRRFFASKAKKELAGIDLDQEINKYKEALDSYKLGNLSEAKAKLESFVECGLDFKSQYNKEFNAKIKLDTRVQDPIGNARALLDTIDELLEGYKSLNINQR